MDCFCRQALRWYKTTKGLLKYLKVCYHIYRVTIHTVLHFMHVFRGTNNQCKIWEKRLCGYWIFFLYSGFLFAPICQQCTFYMCTFLLKTSPVAPPDICPFDQLTASLLPAPFLQAISTSFTISASFLVNIQPVSSVFLLNLITLIWKCAACFFVDCVIPLTEASMRMSFLSLIFSVHVFVLLFVTHIRIAVSLQTPDEVWPWCTLHIFPHLYCTCFAIMSQYICPLIA